MRVVVVLSFLAAAMLFALPAAADDWVVVKLRGTVQEFIDEVWVTLSRGDVVPDERLVRTLADGHADLQRGKEVLTLAANTQITIHDKPGDVRFTTVTQDFGTLEVEAEVENVQHFAVETQFLAAVVKGTHFIVSADDAGASVKVTRGAVAVSSVSSGRSTTVTIGQEARVAPSTDLVVAGLGELPAIVEPEGTALRPALSLEPASIGGAQSAAVSPTGRRPGGELPMSGSGEQSVDTAMLVTPGNAQSIVERSGAVVNSGDMAANGAISAPVDVPPVNVSTILVGMLIGAAVGAIALLFRRSVG
jgi:hypothetical protein